MGIFPAQKVEIPPGSTCLQYVPRGEKQATPHCDSIGTAHRGVGAMISSSTVWPIWIRLPTHWFSTNAMGYAVSITRFGRYRSAEIVASGATLDRASSDVAVMTSMGAKSKKPPSGAAAPMASNPGSRPRLCRGPILHRVERDLTLLPSGLVSVSFTLRPKTPKPTRRILSRGGPVGPGRIGYGYAWVRVCRICLCAEL